MAFFWVGLEDRLSKKYSSSRKHLLIFATIIWSAGLYLTSLANSFTELFAYQMLTAVGYAAITPLAYSIAVDLTRPENRAKTFGLLDVGGMVGGGIGFLLAGTLVDYVPWGVPFVIIATFGLITAGFALNIRDPKKGRQDHELRDILNQNVDYNYHISKGNLSTMLKRKTNLLILILNLILYIASGSITYYFIRMMVNDHGFPSSLAVLFFLAVFASQAVGCLFWTRRADKKFAQNKNGKIRVMIESLTTGPIFLIIAYSLVFSISEASVIGIFTILVMVGMFLLSGLFAISFTILGETNTPELRTTIFSLNNLGQTLGRGIGIALIGILFVTSGNIYHWGFVIMGFIYFGAILFVLPLLHSVPNELAYLSGLLQERAMKIKTRL
jgi:MFS family permease